AWLDGRWLAMPGRARRARADARVSRLRDALRRGRALGPSDRARAAVRLDRARAAASRGRERSPGARCAGAAVVRRPPGGRLRDAVVWVDRWRAVGHDDLLGGPLR